MTQSEDEGLGQTLQTPDLNDVRLEARQCFLQHSVVVLFKFLKVAMSSDKRVIVNSIQQEPAFDFFVALFRLQAVIGGKNQNLVPTQSQRFDDSLAAEIVGARVVWRVEIGQDEDFHRARLSG